MTTTRTTKHVADWLAAHPAPIHKSEVPAWSERVRSELGPEALSDLVQLLAHGDLEQQYQAVAAARALAAEVWADGNEPDMAWAVRLPGATKPQVVRPDQQLPR